MDPRRRKVTARNLDLPQLGQRHAHIPLRCRILRARRRQHTGNLQIFLEMDPRRRKVTARNLDNAQLVQANASISFGGR